MYAVIRTGGKQYKVRAGDTVRVEKLPRELGAEFDLEDVLMIGGDSVHIGAPTLTNAKVTVVVTQQAKNPKVIVFKKKRRQGYRRLKGHRQLFTELFVKAITSPSGETVEAEKEAHVIDPAKKAARVEQHKAKLATMDKKEVKKPKAKKAAPKKAAPKKKAAAKKTAAKKKPAAKKTAAKKPAKKAAKK